MSEEKGVGMWLLDFGAEDDPNTYPDPTAEQIKIEKRAHAQLAALKETLEMLTVPQQREIIGSLANSIFRYLRPGGDENV